MAGILNSKGRIFQPFCLTASILAFLCGAANGGVPMSAVYCRKDATGLEVFAAKQRRGGDLAFGISIWLKTGQHIGVFGTAVRQAGHWIFSDSMNAKDIADRCRIRIDLLPDGTAHLATDASASCQSSGGYGTEIGSIGFSRSDREGAVTFELNDSETFFNKAGKCS
jgi:hypothetical protein